MSAIPSLQEGSGHRAGTANMSILMKDCLPAYARSSLPKLISAAVTLQNIGTTAV
jgi:hypothetical protein